MRTAVKTIGLLTLLGLLNLPVSGQGVDALIATGRAYLEQEDLANAQQSFAAAVAASPDHEVANALLGAARLMTLPYQPAVKQMLDRLGIPETNRNIYNFSLELARDTNNIPVIPADINTQEVVDLLRTNVLLELQAVEGNWAKIVSTNFLLTLTTNETKQATNTTVSFADAQALQAVLSLFDSLINLAGTCNWDAPLARLQSLINRQPEDIQQFLAQRPWLLTLTRTNDLPAAKQAMSKAFDLLASSAPLLSKRDTNYNYLIGEKWTTAVSLGGAVAAMLKPSLEGMIIPQLLPTISLDLSRLFDGSLSPRRFFPAFWHNYMVLGTFPDPTLGNLVLGLSRTTWEEFLARYFAAAPHVVSPGWLPSGSFQIHVDSLTTRAYALESSPDLIHWSRLGVFSPQDGVIVFSDAHVGGATGEYYRAQEVRNDAFSNRVTLPGLPITVQSDNTNATSELGERGYPKTKTLWWTWTASANGPVGISLAGSSYNADLAVYTGSDLAGLSLVTNRMAYDAAVEFNAVAGTTYSISAGVGWSDTYTEPPSKRLKLTVATTPPNDRFADRIALTGTNATFKGYNLAASIEANEPKPLSYGDLDRSVWWTWTAPLTGKTALKLDTDIEAALGVYTGTDLANLIFVAGDSGDMTFDATQGTTYQIVLDGMYGETGPFTLTLSQTP